MARKSLSPGDRIGRYEIARPLAAGGMAEIYLGRATGLGAFEKLVAVKCLHPALDGRGSAVRMFLEEARLVATLDHPHIAQVFDVGQEEGIYFLVMEYVAGRDLGRVLARARERRVPIPLAQVLSIGVALASALHYAHERRDAGGRPLGVVHRDVSPSNVLLSWSGTVKLADFGIAKLAGGGGHTQAGTIRGKLDYMSPEQSRGLPLDRKSDLFSLGTVLYEVVTGRRPFAGRNDAALARAIAEAEPLPPARARPDCPDALAAMLLRLLAKDPAARYGSAHELQVDLERLAASSRLVLSSVALADTLRQLFDRPDDDRRHEPAEATSVPLPRPSVELATATKTVNESRPAVRSSRRGLVLAAAAVVVVAVAVGGLIRSLRSQATRPPPVMAPSPPLAEAADPPPDSPPSAPPLAPAAPRASAPAAPVSPAAPARAPKRARPRTRPAAAPRVDEEVLDDALFPAGKRRRP